MAWDEEQLANANTIIDVGIELGASRRDIRIALMTAMQESSLRNLSGGDLDSVGLFQQRDAWGTFEQRHDPAQAARMFFTGGHAGQRGLFDFDDRDSMALTEAAQAVQVSAYPTAYAKWHDEATDLLRSSEDIEQAGFAASTSAAGAATTADAVQPVSDAELTDSWHAARDGHLHEGIDIMAETGTPVHAIVSGTVVQGFDDEIGGIVVRIEGDDGRYYYYAHLDGVTDGLEVGDRVQTGEVIGAVGSTGNASSTAPHLHLGIYEDDVAVNPYPLLAEPRLPDAEDVPAVDAFAADDGAPPAAEDSDSDGLTDEFERLLHTDVHRADTDKDGRSDLEETTVDHTDPTVADDGDPGGGGKGLGATVTGKLPSTGAFSEEVLAAGFGGAATVDSDRDGISDLNEYNQGTDWLNPDSDDDGLTDELERRLGSNPMDLDSDHDGITDEHEAKAGTIEPIDDLLP